MASQPLETGEGEKSLSRSFAIQMRVIGALVMRELHTRYGRDNVGYLWMIGEPLMLASVITLLHAGHPSNYGGDIRPVPFGVMGYCIFIIFRGIFNRSEGALESNMPLLYHKMVTIFDIMVSRAILEAAGVFLAFAILISLLISIGLSDPIERPLYLIAGIGYMVWLSFAMSLIVVAITHDNRLLGRLVHPFSYFMMPLSGMFYRLSWIPEPYQTWLSYFPLPLIFEMSRYGYFRSADDEFVAFTYLTGCCLVLTCIGLVLIKLLRGRTHLH
jgi:capsular polysaccharide transport system permease protein